MNAVPFVGLINNVALLITLGVFYDLLVVRKSVQGHYESLITGLILGIIGVAVMMNPWRPFEGVVFDARSILLSVGALFFGAVPGCIAAAMTIAYRYYTGGIGTYTGIGVIVTSTLVGILWRTLRPKGSAVIGTVELALMGVVVHALMILWMLSLPLPDSFLVISVISLPVMVLFPIGTVLLGKLLASQSNRQAAAKSLEQSEGNYRLLFDNAPIGILSVDLNGVIIEANQKVLDIMGSPSLEDTKSINMFTYPALVDSGISSLFKECIADRKVLSSDIPYTSKWGKTSFLRIVVTPIVETNGKPYGCQAVIEDMTGRNKAEEVQRRLATAIEQAAEVVIILDEEGIIQYVNPAMEAVSGYNREEAIGFGAGILKSDEHDQAFYDDLWDTLRRGEIWTGHLINRKKDGSLYHVDSTISPVRDRSGRVRNYVAVQRDISREVKLQEQLFQAQKLEAVGTLAGGIAHDFNNILQVILGYSELILDADRLDQMSREDLVKVREAAKNGADLVQRILTFSRKTDIKPQPTNLNLRIEQLRKMLFRTMPKMIRIELKLGENLATINADPIQMEQILMNLAVNARDAMPEGGRLVIQTENAILDEEWSSTHLEAKPGHYVLLTVSDTGSGMSKETQAHIFDPFFTTKRPGEGTGLGLAMVYGIVKQHDGFISCYSEPSKGTVFRLYFPSLAYDEATWEIVQVPTPKGGSETILLVDDEESIRDLGSRILTGAGYEVVTASNGMEALEIYKRRAQQVAVVILDLIMPEMGGKQCLENLTGINPNIKVVIATGYSPDGLAGVTAATGVKGFINKPFDNNLMLATVRKAIDEE
jgi:two-component system, cell cycle sensor histidine kinase and response regulator CckA